MVTFENDWDTLLQDEFHQEYYLALRRFLKEEYRSRTVYPNMFDIFNALKLTAYRDTRVLLLGQDPYHGPGQAHGLAFSVRDGIAPPPSLVNIFQELQNELGVPIPQNGNLTPWARQGILLLNTVLTVRAGQANSHRGKGWETFTDRVIELLNTRETPVIFVLWGGNAKQKRTLITNPIHHVLTAPHPSPLSAHYGFFGCGHFAKINEILRREGQSPINWDLTCQEGIS